jgi:type II secretory pathway pseudopilin PulG
MKLLNRRGVTLVEMLAAIIILTFVFTTVITIIVNLRIQTKRTEEKLVAIEVAKTIRDDIYRSLTYQDIINSIDTSDYEITITNCSEISGACDWFQVESDGKVFDDEVRVVFLQTTSQSLSYQIIHYQVYIQYTSTNELMVEGLIYE